MHSPRPAAEWAKNLVVDQIHGQYACECQYISKMCHHHEFQVTAISNALDAYARAVYQTVVRELSECLEARGYHAPKSHFLWWWQAAWHVTNHKTDKEGPCVRCEPLLAHPLVVAARTEGRDE